MHLGRAEGQPFNQFQDMRDTSSNVGISVLFASGIVLIIAGLAVEIFSGGKDIAGIAICGCGMLLCDRGLK